MSATKFTNSAENQKLPLATADVTQEVQIRLLENSDQAAIPTATVTDHWNERVKEMGNKPALHQKAPTGPYKGKWKTWTWKEYKADVDAFGKALLATADVQKFDMVNIIGFNSPAWLFANFGAIAAGCVPAGIYASNNAEACQYISEHSKAKVVVVEGVMQLKKYYEIAQDLPNLKAIVMYGEEELPSDVKDKLPEAVSCYTFDKFLDIGRKAENNDTLQERSNSWKPGETCTLIYTSGTTGPPKAVMITNDNITWTTRTMLKTTHKGGLDNTDHIISYLPLSHIAAQMLDMHMPLKTGCQVWFAEPDALKGSLGKTLKEVRPTVFFGVPRVWEKIYDKLQEVAKSSTGLKKSLSMWAKGKASAFWEAEEFGSTSSKPFFMFLARKLLGKAHAQLGFDRCWAFYVGAAPIETKILRYFASIDVPILELFGQSECTGPHSVNCLNAWKIGSVGRPMLGTESKNADSTKELCFRGRHVLAGYMGMPDKTAETIDSEGWLHTGDVVKIDEDHDARVTKPSGFISITGRIKELIITAGGENVPPVLIEEALKEAMPAVSNAMVIGDKRKFLTVLICLQVEIDMSTGVASNKLTGVALDTCQEIGSSAKTTDEARDDPAWKTYIENGVKTANSKATSRAQNIGKYHLLSTDFTEKGGELTPTLKLKRSVAAEKYSDIIEGMYAQLR